MALYVDGSGILMLRQRHFAHRKSWSIPKHHAYPSNSHEPLWKSEPRTLQCCLGNKAMEQRLNLPKGTTRRKRTTHWLHATTRRPHKDCKVTRICKVMQGYIHSNILSQGASHTIFLELSPTLKTWWFNVDPRLKHVRMCFFSNVCRPGPSSWQSCWASGRSWRARDHASNIAEASGRKPFRCPLQTH